MDQAGRKTALAVRPGTPLTIDGHSPSAIYSEHERLFASLSGWLDDYYGAYSNSDKLISLLSYWLYGYRCLLESYGEDGVAEFCRSGVGSHVRFAYLYEYGVDIDLNPRTFKSRALFPLGAAVMPAAYLPGGLVRSAYTKGVSRLTKYAALNTPVSVRRDRKRALVQKLADIFGRDDAGTMAERLDAKLPAIFFADQVEVLRGSMLTVDCSPSAFMDFCGYENILLFNRRLRIIGRQHGGGYDLYAVDYLVDFEKRLCDVFIGWGMSTINEHQHKYPSSHRPCQRDPRAQRRIIVIERPLLPAILHPMSPPLYAQFRNQKAIAYVCEELRASGTPFYSLEYPGKLRSPDYSGMRGEKLTGGRGEHVICGTDVAIFDLSAASLVHFCIEHAIPFLFVVSPDDVPQFSEAHKEWFQVLRTARLAFLDDEAGALGRRVGEMVSGDFELPAEVRAYHKRTFLDIGEPVRAESMPLTE